MLIVRHDQLSAIVHISIQRNRALRRSPEDVGRGIDRTFGTPEACRTTWCTGQHFEGCCARQQWPRG
eukprot:528828-Prymnesium_polylepis.1